MRPLLTELMIFAASAAVIAAPAAASDEEANVPLQPSDAAGPWTLQVLGHAVCVLVLGKAKAPNGAYSVKVDGDCGGDLPAGVSGWAPAPKGMSLTGADGRPEITFDRWSNSLFVSKRSSGSDIQLRRGTPHETPG